MALVESARRFAVLVADEPVICYEKGFDKYSSSIPNWRPGCFLIYRANWLAVCEKLPTTSHLSQFRVGLKAGISPPADVRFTTEGGHH
jgi:hypothetical protein